MASLVGARRVLTAAAEPVDEEGGASVTVIIIIVVVAVLALAVLCWYCCWYQRRSQRSDDLIDYSRAYVPSAPDVNRRDNTRAYAPTAPHEKPPPAAYAGGSVDDQPPPFDGFLTSTDTLAASSIWLDSDLLSCRINEKTLRRKTLMHQDHRTQIWIGTLESREVVIKQLWDSLYSMTAAAAFASEAKKVVNLRHPRIVQLVGVAWHNSLDFQVVTEYQSNRDLRSLLHSEAGRTLTWQDGKCAIAIDVADALQFLHEQRPSKLLGHVAADQVLIDDALRAKINVARVSSQIGLLSVALSSMTPELLVEGAVTDRSDVFAFGVLLSELDTARPPYKQADGSVTHQVGVVQGIASGELLPSFSDECPDSIRELATECLALDPSDRPSASQIAYRLRDILKSEL